MRRIATLTVAAAAMVAGAVGITGAVPALAAQRPAPPASAYYLSLGDSLAQGVQPNSQGVSVETKQGYPDQLFTALRLGNPALRLVKLGCPGETTGTMINGGICTYKQGSQLAQAVAFLKAHASATQLVTIDIGANDLNPCLALTDINQIVACLEKVIPVAVQNLTTIMTQLRTAGGTSLKIIGMSYYDPVLADWLLGTPAAQTLAQDSVALAKGFNASLGQVYTGAGASVANVYGAFHTGAFTATVTLPAFGVVPKDVGYICMYTWECAAPPVGPNEHANRLGYAVIANAFLTTYLG
ncbi:MAG TPA: SGNH/GDSL hydrolase family protein [Streptosporangiaceae bacterium]|nr:SGNH/GDSL hydrolase family protein [Streptosporangiaceae bacterium]